MSKSPRMYISASFYRGILTEDEIDEFNNELDALGFQVASEYDDSGIVGNFAPNYVTIFTFLTSGWGDAINAEEFVVLCNDFVTTVDTFCTNEPRCKSPSYKYGATFY